jgi:hypothetical protein
MDKMLLVITIFIAISFAMVGVYSMGIVPTIFDTKKETTNQTDIIVKEFSRESNKTNQSINLLKTIFNTQIQAREDRDKKNEDIMIILALLNHETRQLIKLNLDAHNITDYHDYNFLNLRHTGFPFYYTNKTHVTIELNESAKRSIPIPYEMSNLLMQLDQIKPNATINDTQK